MPLFALIQYEGDTVVSTNYDLSEFSHFVRKTVKEIIDFNAETLAKRVKDPLRPYRVPGDGPYNMYMFTAWATSATEVWVAVTDHAIDVRSVMDLIRNVKKEIAHNSRFLANPSTMALLNSDKKLWRSDIAAVSDKLVEVKAVLVKCIEDVLERGEKLEDLVAKSHKLSETSRTWHTKTRKLNGWCGWPWW